MPAEVGTGRLKSRDARTAWASLCQVAADGRATSEGGVPSEGNAAEGTERALGGGAALAELLAGMCGKSGSHMIIQPRLAVGLLLALATPAVGSPGMLSNTALGQCATGNCAAMGGHGPPQQGNALTVTGKTDGGTYTPGETLNLAITGNGRSDQYIVAGYAGGQVLGRSDNNQGTVTAPQAEELVLIGLVAPGSGQTVT